MSHVCCPAHREGTLSDIVCLYLEWATAYKTGAESPVLFTQLEADGMTSHRNTKKEATAFQPMKACLGSTFSNIISGGT